VRQALLLAINRQEVVSAVYTSQTKPATSVLASTTPSYVDDSANVVFDAAKAKSVLDAAGWTAGPDGIRAKAGQRLTIPLSFANNAATNKPTLELLQQQAKAVGIDLQVQEFPIAQFPTIQSSGDFVAIWANLTRADPDILRSTFSVAGANYYRVPPSPLEPLLVAQAGEPDPAKRTQIVAQAQKTLDQLGFWVPVAELTTVLGVGPNAHGITFDASSRIQLHDAWKPAA
jgi:peptide/nickel transport system substrate-binding protein